jgi:hypothetical protein
MSGAASSAAGTSRRRERSTLWQDSMSFHDSFFSSGSRRELDSGHGDLRDMRDMRGGLTEALGNQHHRSGF